MSGRTLEAAPSSAPWGTPNRHLPETVLGSNSKSSIRQVIAAHAMNQKSYEFAAELPPHWLGNLAGHLAGQSADIRSVDATLVTGGVWQVSVAILMSESAPSQREL